MSYADSVIHEALITASGGLDLEMAGRALQDALEALAAQAAALKKAKYEPEDGNIPWHAIARSMTHTAKMIDGIARLLQFAKGQPDSRPDLRAGFLASLTDEQITQIEEWVQENKRRQTAPEEVNQEGQGI